MTLASATMLEDHRPYSPRAVGRVALLVLDITSAFSNTQHTHQHSPDYNWAIILEMSDAVSLSASVSNQSDTSKRNGAHKNAYRVKRRRRARGTACRRHICRSTILRR